MRDIDTKHYQVLRSFVKNIVNYYYSEYHYPQEFEAIYHGFKKNDS